MPYRLAADAVLVLHLAFIVFAMLGAALTLRWRWVPYLHLPAAAWGFFVEMSGRICPLTPLENELRAQAGQSGYEGGFIEHYLVGLIYPSGLTRDIQYLLAAMVIATNAAIYGWVLLRRRKSRPVQTGPA
jgi:hypothetical protein